MQSSMRGAWGEQSRKNHPGGQSTTEGDDVALTGKGLLEQTRTSVAAGPCGRPSSNFLRSATLFSTLAAHFAFAPGAYRVLLGPQAGRHWSLEVLR